MKVKTREQNYSNTICTASLISEIPPCYVKVLNTFIYDCVDR